ncbi:MAG: polysaccharide deacetylase family protein [Scytolyngbya sp. HA4215-MV1]|nr:polysaccharide deacetylase family protein [Scytolyngbya sp. HA4215-MV1]
MQHPGVSIIIPAHNAAATLSDTLTSVYAQTFPDWEAIVINNGSSDDTAEVAARFARQDRRIIILNQSQVGVCVARNAGIQRARFDWLLFLDADDWLAPTHLETLFTQLSIHPDWDAVHCGWSNVTPDGQVSNARYGKSESDLFPVLTRCCTFAIHTCLVRKSLVEHVGGFDRTLKTCEDWDLWQRIARMGAKFGLVPEVLAFYRMRPDSLSRNANQYLTDAMRVIAQGHATDPRVPLAKPAYTKGQPIEALAKAQMLMTTWIAGLFLGQGKDAHHLLDLSSTVPTLELEPAWVADNLFESILIPACQAPSVWIDRWQLLEAPILKFLQALEEKLPASGFAHRTLVLLARLVLQETHLTQPMTLATIHAIQVDITQPLVDVYSPEQAESLYGWVTVAGEPLGTIELPICNGVVASVVLADTIAATFAWKILGRFFEHTIYPPATHEEIQLLHDEIGWRVLLQQLWNRPDWSDEQFYDATEIDPTATRQPLEQDWLTIEISEEFPDIEVNALELTVLPTVAGAALGCITVPVKNNFVTAQAVRVAVLLESHFELCCAVVREGLLGRSLTDPTPLRERLAASAQQKRSYQTETMQLACSYNPELLKNALVFGRRYGAIGTSDSRQAMLPAAAAPDMLQAAIAAHEPIIQTPAPGQALKWVIYAPDLIQHPYQRYPLIPADQTPMASARRNDRSEFETLFATQPDPWKYTSPYEQTKYEQTLSLLPHGKVNKALELACAEGHFTVQLAAKVKHLTVTDISQIALDRTADRCQQFQHLDFQRLDLVKDTIPGRFNLIVCSEVLYYVGGKDQLVEVAHKITQALEPGGYLLMAHAHAVVDEPDQSGFGWNNVPFGAKGISDVFCEVPDLSLAKEIWTPLYRIQLFQRRPPVQLPWQRSIPKLIRLAQQPTPLPPDVEAHVLWQGGTPRDYEEVPVVTDRLPILMYHRVAPAGTDRLSRYRVTPQAFEQQLQYLRDAGYYSVLWEQWREAMVNRRPLPGRAIALTFDDGYQDFLDYAAPLLKQYGFSATVFLVANQVGGANVWDQAYQEEIPLMNWHTIRQLQTEGIEFGSHTATHPLLTALSPVEIVKEATRSRAILERELGVPIRTIAYPYGDHNAVVQHLIGACGYTVGLSCRSGRSGFRDALLSLPRIEIEGSDSLKAFVAKLGS